MPIGIGMGLMAASGLASAGIGAAGAASAADAQAAQAAAQLAYQKKIYEDAQGNFKPYMGLGEQGLTAQKAALSGFTAPYTQEQYRQSPLYTPMVSNLAELQATPGYQFQLQQGQQAINNSAAAQGGLLSGATQQALANYGQQQAATGFSNAWTRAQGAYQQAFNQNQAQNLQASNINMGAVTAGQNAVAGLGNIGVGMAAPMAATSNALGAAQGASAMAPYMGASQAMGTIGSYFGQGGNLGGMFGTGGGSQSLSGGSGLSGMTMQGAGYTPAGGSFGTFGLGLGG